MKSDTPTFQKTAVPQDRFRLLFEHSSDAHFIIMAEDRITDCNEAAVKLLKCKSKEDVLSRHPAQFSPRFQPDGSLSEEKSRQMDMLARKNGFHRFEWMHQTVEGEVFPVQVTLNAIEIDGKSALIAVWHDLTELKQKEGQLRAANEKMRRDLDAAASVQRNLLPVSSPFVKGFRASWIFKPCDELGGDMLNIFALDERYVGLYVLDVTGHGVAASLLSVAASHLLSPYSDTSFVRSAGSRGKLGIARPAEVVCKLNRHFSANPDFIQIFTLLYGVLDTESYEFRYISAGHPPPAVLSSGENPRVIEGAGVPVGVVPDYAYQEQCLKLNPGDRLYLYSDGIIEAKSPVRELFGQERFLSVLGRTGGDSLTQSIEKIMRETENWTQPLMPGDDITLLAFELCSRQDKKCFE